jgi:hypothetical protein
MPPNEEGTNEEIKKKKLLSCSKCHSAAYHDITCQRAHWLSGHKQDCKRLQNALKPLLELMKWQRREDDVKYVDYTSWLSMDMMAEFFADNNDLLWQNGIQQWNNQNYLDAMVTFQCYLAPYKKAWHSHPSKRPFYVDYFSGPANEELFCDSALQLAKRLLFCAYCEIDGGEIESGRLRLVQCLSLLITIRPLNSSSELEVRETMDDAWMELSLSMEEIPSDRMIARHVAKMAIATKSCGWVYPLQRPGYLAKMPLD